MKAHRSERTIKSEQLWMDYDDIVAILKQHDLSAPEGRDIELGITDGCGGGSKTLTLHKGDAIVFKVKGQGWE
jgi:hypothetical protein